jgi:hypothetical protein
MPRPSHSPLFCRPWWRVQLTELSCHFIPLRSKYSAKHPVLRHPQSVLFSWRERPGFAPIQNSYNYPFIHFNLYVFWQLTGRYEILNCMVTSILQLRMKKTEQYNFNILLIIFLFMFVSKYLYKVVLIIILAHTTLFESCYLFLKIIGIHIVAVLLSY